MTDTHDPAGRSDAHPPATAEGWFALHQIFTIDRARIDELSTEERAAMRAGAMVALGDLATASESGAVSEPHSPSATGGTGWSAAAELVGGSGDVMLVHFRPTLDALYGAQRAWSRTRLSRYLTLKYAFISVTEAGFYHASAELAREAAERGGSWGDARFNELMAERVGAETGSPHVQRRLFPPLPAEMRYICFYPMSKRRTVGQNWYALSLEERSRLMHAHGLTGRRYAGKVMQVITGAIGFAEWEWGVTLFARDPLDFKRLITDMRFDEVSAQYADFGEFYVGMVTPGEAWVESVAG
jgi:hydrogen peroxide-dependent heme synthase